MKSKIFGMILFLLPPSLFGVVLAPVPKSESEKVLAGDFIEKSEEGITYKVRAIKVPNGLIVEAEIYNQSSSIIEISPELFHASELDYAIRYIPLAEVLAGYQRTINYESLRFQNARQQANSNVSYSGSATTTNLGNQSYTTANIGPNPYSQFVGALGTAIVASQTRSKIEQAQEGAQAAIDYSLAPTSLPPQTRCKGAVYFERKGAKGDIRVTIIRGEKYFSFYFKDVPYLGILNSESQDESLELGDIDPNGSLKLAGFKYGDRLISFDGVEVNSKSELLSLVRKHSIGETVTIQFDRNYKKKSLPVLLVGPP